MALQNEMMGYTGYVVWVNVPNSQPRPIEWFAPHVQDKAHLLIAALNEYGEAYIDGIGAIGPDAFSSNDGSGMKRIIHIYATKGE